MKNAIIYSLIILAALASETQAGNLNLTSYYPSPSGSYRVIQLIPQPAINPDTNCPIGTIYANANDYSRPYYCTPGAILSKYQKLPGLWVLDASNFLYPADTTSRTVPQLISEKIGLGTENPTFKLTLTNDGGILADNTYSTYTSLPNLGAGTRLVHYPLKHSFRAGYAAGNEWDSANIGDTSTALGSTNTASGQYSTILGGQGNTATIPISSIAGGKNNLASGANTAILGGENNSTAVDVGGTGAHWVGGYNNSVSCGGASIDDHCGINGGLNNTIQADFYGYNTIVGGSGNIINYSSVNNVIGGGRTNLIGASQVQTILGGRQNTIGALTQSKNTILGGSLNSSLGYYGTIGGGVSNTIPRFANHATVSGGEGNTATKNESTVSGGKGNTASGLYSNVSGGQNNTASGTASSILGGFSNVASGAYSIIVGGESNNTAGDYTLAAGKNMALSALADRTFLWGYSSTALASPIATPDAFIIYSGRVGIRDITPAALLEINANGSITDNYLDLTSDAAVAAGNKLIVKNSGSGTAFIGVGITNPTYPLQFAGGAYVDAGGNFMPASSREYKENINHLTLTQARETLNNLNPVRYHYKNKKDKEYVGFIAEDVPSLVVNKEREGLAPMDIIAVLTKVVQDQQATLKEQKEESQELLNEYTELEKRMKAQGIR